MLRRNLRHFGHSAVEATASDKETPLQSEMFVALELNKL